MDEDGDEPYSDREETAMVGGGPAELLLELDEWVQFRVSNAGLHLRSWFSGGLASMVCVCVTVYRLPGGWGRADIAPVRVREIEHSVASARLCR